MGIFTRFRDIVGSNINSMLDRAEDPEKLIKLMIQEMEDTLIELKSACAGVMAESKKIERQSLALDQRLEYWEAKANLAVNKGRDDLAREALLEKRRQSERSQALAYELSEHEALLTQYKEDIRQLEDKLKSAREKERMLVQRHIHAVRKKRAQEEMRRIDSAEAVFKFEELEQRIEHMEAEADLVNFGRKPTLEDELDRLSLDDEIESELKAIKASAINKMEERVDALETIIDDVPREGANHEQL
ncbi:Phage shock protein A @ Suppressor of sigma54-dependent transcription, PspA-like [Olavius algarvensis Delta 1 endosymbiont]|nr:Phage shock protein A @ Suppressor of sigma54-dependent transcription, PspA-like [Olavius algarvensis Delta 1 endosymbiont]